MGGRGAVARRRVALWLSVALPGCAMLAAPSMAHDIDVHLRDSRLDAPGVVVEFTLSAGPSAALAGYRVFAPGEQVPFQEGKTDRLGRVAFVPDRPGTWRIEVPDFQGLAGTSTVDVSAGDAAPAEPAWRRWLIRGSVLANIVLVLILLLVSFRRRAARSMHPHPHLHDDGHVHDHGHSHPGTHRRDHRPDTGSAPAAPS